MHMILTDLLKDIRNCDHCKAYLPCGANPIVQMHQNAKILVVGQAPGRIVHETGIPFDDKSGERLRDWMGITPETFYTPHEVAILPMGFCYPGTGPNGDLPPRPECTRLWREKALEALPNIETTLVIGKHAMAWHIDKKTSVTKTVENWHKFAPTLFPLPHPSPRNNIWFKKNPWFEAEVIPQLKSTITHLLKN